MENKQTKNIIDTSKVIVFFKTKSPPTKHWKTKKRTVKRPIHWSGFLRLWGLPCKSCHVSSNWRIPPAERLTLNPKTHSLGSFAGDCSNHKPLVGVRCPACCVSSCKPCSTAKHLLNRLICFKVSTSLFKNTCCKMCELFERKHLATCCTVFLGVNICSPLREKSSSESLKALNSPRTSQWLKKSKAGAKLPPCPCRRSDHP